MRRTIRSRTADLSTALLFSAMAALAAGKSNTAPKAGRVARSAIQGQSWPPTLLYPSGKLEFALPPPVAIMGGTQCDTDGDIFVRYVPSIQALNQMAEARTIGNLALTELRPDSQTTVRFPVGPFSGHRRVYGLGFYVMPSGTVYGLAQDCSGGRSGISSPCPSLVAKYNDDGSLDSLVKLHPPQGEKLDAYKVAAFPDGNLLVWGDIRGGRETPASPFAGIFGPGGGFLANLSREVRIPVAGRGLATRGRRAAASAGRPPAAPPSGGNPGLRWLSGVTRSLMVGSLGGNLYVLQPGEPGTLYTLSSGGTVLSTHAVVPPQKGMLPISVSVNGDGELVVFFVHKRSPASGPAGPLLAVVDPQSGKVVSTYEVPPKAGSAACMTTANEFLFVRESKSGHLEIVKYAPIQ